MAARRDIGKRARTTGTVDAELRLSPPGYGGGACTDNKYVKVSVEGAQYQRKVDLGAYGGHAELRAALLGLAGQMLGLIAWCSSRDMVVAYEDKDDNILLAGDLPWDMFVSDCRSVRIMRQLAMMTKTNG
ncbi:auxin-responsive protein IAA14-like [Triticum dicoccoides]|uniref:auxin-responsive protein IAA14-like n=1 Tax=Triticum dicoccoides TaxID=85692 RepID=UPI00188FE8AB|nr:auxin-responsive protein IAA14-like [Triticum dicoccoides]